MKRKEQQTVSNQLRKAIRDSGLTSYAIGKAAHVAPIGIDRFLAGGTMRLVTIDRICKVLNLSLSKGSKE